MGIERRIAAGAVVLASLFPSSTSIDNAPKPPFRPKGIVSSHIETTETALKKAKLERKMSSIPRSELESAVILTKAGYEKFLRTINTEYMDEAAAFGEFNPSLLLDPLIRVRQGPLKLVVLHYTVAYYNDLGILTNREPVGEFNPMRFIHSMVAKPGLSCCSAQAVIDRDARPFQFASWDKRLRHNPPYDEESVGIEIEAHTQGAITNRQLEAALYWSTYIMLSHGLLEGQTLEETLVGHAETRARHPEFDYRADFPGYEMVRVRSLERKFLHELGHRNV